MVWKVDASVDSSRLELPVVLKWTVQEFDWAIQQCKSERSKRFKIRLKFKLSARRVIANGSTKRPRTIPFHLWPSTLDLTQKTPKFGNIPSCQITKVLIFWTRPVWRIRESPNFRKKLVDHRGSSELRATASKWLIMTSKMKDRDPNFIIAVSRLSDDQFKSQKIPQNPKSSAKDPTLDNNN